MKLASRTASTAEDAKRRTYSGLSQGYCFVPICVETTGVAGPEAGDFVQQLGRKLVEKTGDRNAGAYFRQRIGLAVQRGNAMCFYGTFTGR